MQSDTVPPYARAIEFIQEFRRYAITLLIAIAVATAGFYFISRPLFSILQNHLQQELVFFTVAEPFLAHVKIAISTALFTLMPMLVFCVWKALARPFKLTGRSVFWFVCFTCFLFYSGSLFCYFITLPYGIKFLLGFGSEQLQPVISVERFITFIAVFILAFGLIFELPIFMVFSAQAGLISRATFAKNRRYAVLVISIVAALLTPTPDVVNMMLMGLPLYALYELGIIVLKILRI